MVFHVLKTINNNIVSCLDENKQEYIVMGRGLGFGVKQGAVIDQERVEKVFSISNPANLEQLKDLLARCPQPQVEFCTELIQYATQVLDHPLNEGIYLTLCDHICFAIRRAESGMGFTNALHTEVRLFYPQEYNIGCHALTEIQRRFNVTLPQDEAASIALHLVNAEHEMSLGITLKVTQALGQMLHTLESNDKFHLDRTTIYYDELVIHLKFLALDLYSPRDTLPADEQFSDLIMQAFPQDYHLAEILTKELETACGKELSKEQKAYLAVHLHRINKGKEGVKEHGTI